MEKQHVIFIDIDGTLLSKTGVPQENLEAIQEVREAGHLVLLNTGRSYANIPEDILSGIPLDGVVSALGADVRYQDEVLHSALIDTKKLLEIATYFQSADRTLIFEGDEQVYVINHTPDSYLKPGMFSEEFFSSHASSRVHVIAAPGMMTERERELFQDEFFILEHDHYYECVLKGNSKSYGMKIIMDHLGLSMEDSIAIGDSLNDLDMLEHAGFSIAMDDALDTVKEACDAVTTTAEEAGVAVALRKYVLNRMDPVSSTK